MAGSVPISAACFVMLAACGALCQQRQEKASSLPDAPVLQASAQANINGSPQFGNSVFYQEKTDQNSARDFFIRPLYPTLPKRNLNYHPANEGLVRRATDAASRTLITRDHFGKARLNTTYLLRTLTSVAKDTASTPYWRRRFADPFSDFGSTIGNDVGLNVLHEFEPGIERLLKNHMPKFVTAMEEHRVRAGQR
ncbi:MAG TPA: hypothetical protein VN950_12010 [Terriglobales bacterium]|nr:hypothetical protein [Terriglobales bacterium]